MLCYTDAFVKGNSFYGIFRKKCKSKHLNALQWVHFSKISPQQTTLKYQNDQIGAKPIEHIG